MKLYAINEAWCSLALSLCGFLFGALVPLMI